MYLITWFLHIHDTHIQILLFLLNIPYTVYSNQTPDPRILYHSFPIWCSQHATTITITTLPQNLHIILNKHNSVFLRFNFCTPCLHTVALNKNHTNYQAPHLETYTMKIPNNQSSALTTFLEKFNCLCHSDLWKVITLSTLFSELSTTILLHHIPPCFKYATCITLSSNTCTSPSRYLFHLLFNSSLLYTSLSDPFTNSPVCYLFPRPFNFFLNILFSLKYGNPPFILTLIWFMGFMRDTVCFCKVPS